MYNTSVLKGNVLVHPLGLSLHPSLQAVEGGVEKLLPDFATSCNQALLNRSPCTSHMLYNMHAAAIILEIWFVCISLCFVSLCHLAFNLPYAFSTAFLALHNL